MTKESEERLGKLIGRVSLFSELSEKQRKNVAKSGVERSFDAGHAIVREGETGVGFYLILDGNVEVRKKRKILSTLSAGDFFGEMGLIDDQPRSADVVATTPTSTLCISQWTFAGIVKGNPDIAMGMMKVLAERLRKSNKALSE
ncbi:MAG: cyclic nucleotide-binding domain-containing protein [Nitrososphaerota archaeon]|nr:cyclic nucleotide-binding domain-containing protein [Nitrososphaerota archaeon]